MITENEQKVYDVLKTLEIEYVRYEHKAVYTVEEANNLDIKFKGQECKNLFLRNAKGKIHYLVLLDDKKRVDLKALAKQIGSTPLSFASEERLFKYLKLRPGSVTPLGLINDEKSEVIVLIDKDIVTAELVNFHPNVNTATVGIAYADLEKFLTWHRNEFRYVDI